MTCFLPAFAFVSWIHAVSRPGSDPSWLRSWLAELNPRPAPLGSRQHFSFLSLVSVIHALLSWRSGTSALFHIGMYPSHLA